VEQIERSDTRQHWFNSYISLSIRQLQRKLESISEPFVCANPIWRAMDTSFRWYWRILKYALILSEVEVLVLK
jgi:hypothetical protein